MSEPRALYVEFDPYAAAWLQNLISRDVIAGGDVYCGDVRDCRPRDLAKYTQVHLYAGIGVWSYGMRRSGIPDSTNVWTFSEPCQPFSAAGKGLGFADERYLRPYTHHLVTQCRPAICLGEQVASGDGLAWLDVVQSDMEDASYAGGAIDTCSAGFGAPHIRQRLRLAYASAEWLADAAQFRHAQRGQLASDQRDEPGSRSETMRRDDTGFVGDTERAGLEGLSRHGDDRDQSRRIRTLPYGYVAAPGSIDGLADAAIAGRGEWRQNVAGSGERSNSEGLEQRLGHNSLCRNASPTNGFWADADWLYCRDGKWRPVEPGTFPLAHGAASRVGRLRAYGNAVDAEATTNFCRAVAETLLT